jgi:SPOR domain
MKKLFLALLLVNVALFGWLRGTHSGTGREPGRLDQQIAAERIRVLTDVEVDQLEKRAREAKATAPAGPIPRQPEATVACVEIGEFVNDVQLDRLRDKLAALKLTDRASEQTKERPGWYHVYLPEKTLPDVEQRAEQLRTQGLQDLVIYKEGPLHYSVGLGSFRDRDAARKLVAQLERRGVKGARVADSPATLRATRVVIRGADAASVQQLQDAQKDFPQQKLQPCPSGPVS